MIQVNEFAKAVADAMDKYGVEAAEAAKAAVDRVAAGAEQEVKKHITFKQRTGKYVRAFRMSTSYNDLWTRRKTWYVLWPHHRLAHLLEYEHLNRSGTAYIKAYPHIIYGEQYVEDNLEKEVAESIANVRL